MLLPLSVFFNAFGMNYFISNHGNDSDTGNDPSRSWVSLEKLNNFPFEPGDSVFFRRGSVFSGELEIKSSGVSGTPIYFGAYGGGYAPVFSGGVEITGFSLKGGSGKTYEAICTNKVKTLYIGNKLQILARSPNYPYFHKASGGDFGKITDPVLTEANNYWTGARVRFRPVNWVYEHREINSSSNGVINYDATVRYPMKNEWGYYLENKFELLDSPGEWYYDPTQKKLLLYSATDPVINGKSVSATIFDNGIMLDSAVSFIFIENLIFRDYAGSGILGIHSNTNITVHNCSFQNITESGIRFLRRADSCIITGNYFKDILGRGISFTEAFNNQISYNQINRIGLIPGYGISGVNNASGIVMEIRDETRDRKLDYFETPCNNNYIGYNQIDSCGYIGIRCDGQNNLIERNTVDNCLLTLADGAGIYCFSSNTYNSVIKNNFVMRSVGNMAGTPESNPIANGIYIDNNCYNIKLDSNTVVDNKSAGILINASAHDNFISNNVLYGNMGCQLNFSDWLVANTTINNTTRDNVFFSSSASVPCILLLSNWSYNVGTFSNNSFINPYNSKVVQKSWKENVSLSLSQWQSASGQDLNSLAITGIWTYPMNKSLLFTNQTSKIREIDLTGKNITDLAGTLVSKIILNPYSSRVLLASDLSLTSDILLDLVDLIPPFKNYVDEPDYTAVAYKYLKRDLCIFPNPNLAGNSVCIELFSETEAIGNLSLFDLQSKLVYSLKQAIHPGLVRYEMDYNFPEKGLYLLSIMTQNTAYVGKVDIQ